jgi:SAM-dependent methyltransferase
VGDDRSSTVVAHYSHGGLLAAILRGLAATGKPTDRIDSDDLAAGDEFHIGGREATSALFDQLGWQSEMQVLDLGSGIGGPARYLARHRDAPVIGVDLTPEFIEVAREPTRRCGLAETVEFQVGSGLELPIRTVASMQPASCMSGRTSRTSHGCSPRYGGWSDHWFAVYEVMRVGAGEIDHPLPWASDARASFVADRETYHRLLEEAGFRVEHERDRREFGIESLSRLRASWTQGPPPLGPHIVIGHGFPTKVTNPVAAMRRGLFAPIEMISTATKG